MESKNNFVISNDGARIHYCTVGSGPSLIVIPGMMSLAADYKALADALAGTFTIHTIERRGRGLSDPQAKDYSIVKEREDVIALQKKTKAAFFFGHSFGGLVALEAARNNFDLKKLAVFEPGISVNGSISAAWSSRYKQQLEHQRYVDAFAGFSIAAGPDRARKAPLWLMKLISRIYLHRFGDQTAALLRANLREHSEIARLDNSYENYREIAAPALLLSGGKSALAYVPPAMHALAFALPNCTAKTFDRLDHFGPVKSGTRAIAQALIEYFTY